MSWLYDLESLRGLNYVVVRFNNRAGVAKWSKCSREIIGALKKHDLGHIELRLLPSKPFLIPAVYRRPLSMKVLHEFEACFTPPYGTPAHIAELLRRYAS